MDTQNSPQKARYARETGLFKPTEPVPYIVEILSRFNVCIRDMDRVFDRVRSYVQDMIVAPPPEIKIKKED